MTQSPPAKKSGFTQPLFDCDVHELMLDATELRPWLKQPWRDWVGPWTGLYRSPLYVHPLLSSAGQSVANSVAAGSSSGIRGVDFERFRDEHLDYYNVRHAVLTGFFYVGVMRSQPEFSVALASAYNDWLVENWLSKDPRLLGSITITPQEPEAAAREIDRMGKHPQMVQILLPLTDVAYGEPRYHPIYAACERNDLRVAFHQSHWTATPVGLTMRRNIEWHSSFSLAFMAQLISVIFEGVIEKYPRLRFIMLEGGYTWLPHMLRRLDQHYKELRVEVPWVKRLPSETIREHFRFGSHPTEGLSARELAMVFELCGSDDLVCFASDYPHWDGDEPAFAFPSGLAPDLLNKLMLTNALDFYGLSGETDAGRA